MTQKASSGESFRLEDYTTNLVFDIIGLILIVLLIPVMAGIFLAG